MNWLNTSTGSPPAYKFAIQPGEGGYSANANIQLWTPSDAGYNPSNLYRNSLAQYFLPSVDEWYKAAYYDPTSGVYYDYPTGSNSAAHGRGQRHRGWHGSVQSAQARPCGHHARRGPESLRNDGPGRQCLEWEETDFDLVNDSSSSARGVRGGGWLSVSSGLSSSIRLQQPDRREQQRWFSCRKYP